MENENYKYVKFPSHRAREYSLREIAYAGLPKPQAFSSFRRNIAKGIYRVTDKQLHVLEHADSQHVRFTRLRGPFDDLLGCWE